ncbi:MAG: RHS repeat protein [Pyrinomonadaceae bacterium]|nr:RHS repeat protein [Pyrinomonadaceae bacterium]
MGRVVKHRQWITGQQYDLEYGYNLAGQLISEKYPSGRVVTNSYDAKGRLAGVADGSRTFLSGLEYEGKGGSVSSMAFGNATVQSFALNDRLQMVNQTLTKDSSVLQKYDYGYGQIDGSGNLDTTKNNGQLAKIESYIGTNKQWTQKFQYDHIGRLKETEERRGDTNALSYKQTFDFDRFGNMYRKAASNPTSGQENPLPYTAIEASHISKSTNRLTSATNYDEAGNVVSDDKFRESSFSYDANGRMVSSSSNMAMVDPSSAVYDAAGQRVATFLESMVWTFFVYDAFGRMVTEYGGMTAVDEGGVKYLLSDWQGSNRAVVSNSGYVLARTDYTAYGEEIASSVGLRTVAQGFAGNLIPRQKYALTERDEASCLAGMPLRYCCGHHIHSGYWFARVLSNVTKTAFRFIRVFRLCSLGS